ncbi:hypothetical protein [Mycobacterium intracellulare]|uniref:Uncharacterized protein n=1 Tax=Mycobacterium intracellulare TaxID=1767 RepID=A0AAE4R7C6_MYCIT|nr:hypothetical protein [Mycobacterium intracellulare]MDV6975278.1 hypothetical protein [Mycobacterium intracellulare]MDV6980342.1 hypothetical protein [Mycobacterium intracellulare]MDV7010771.1 hypothetical protein [Mycobacterium intracellulare]MDV7025677.1 hypothetical protein [Mycobacterium intracellulare]
MFEFTKSEYLTAAKVVAETYPNSPWAVETFEQKALKAGQQADAAQKLGYQAKLLGTGSSEVYVGTQLMKLLMDWGWTPPEALR